MCVIFFKVTVDCTIFKFFEYLNLRDVLWMMQVIFGNRWRHLLGESDFWEHVGGIDISLTPSSFGQANTRVCKTSTPVDFS